jgi:hypothetical protein
MGFQWMVHSWVQSHDIPWYVLIWTGLHEGPSPIGKQNRAVLLVKNLKLGPSDFIWGFRSEIIRMTCHPTWHTLYHQKIGPKIIRECSWDGDPISSLNWAQFMTLLSPVVGPKHSILGP